MLRSPIRLLNVAGMDRGPRSAYTWERVSLTGAPSPTPNGRRLVGQDCWNIPAQGEQVTHRQEGPEAVVASAHGAAGLPTRRPVPLVGGSGPSPQTVTTAQPHFCDSSVWTGSREHSQWALFPGNSGLAGKPRLFLPTSAVISPFSSSLGRSLSATVD